MPIATSAPPRAQPAQSSIRSFFQTRTPNFTPPPSAAASQRSSPKPNPITPPKQSTPPPSNASNGLPACASISEVEEKHIQPLRRINSLLLLSYPDSFYHNILTPSNFSRVILWTDPGSSEAKVVGGMVCRLDPCPSNPSSFDMYIQSLALLSPYRSKGLATALVNIVIAAAVQYEAKIESLYAHVWTENNDGLEWYAARGFKREEPIIPGYYRRLKPDTALVVRRKLVPSDHLQSSPPLSSTAGGPPVTTSLRGSRPTVPHAASFQDRRPECEWNDLPDDLGLKPVTEPGSRSSSSSRTAGSKKKKDRQYPAAAFGA